MMRLGRIAAFGLSLVAGVIAFAMVMTSRGAAKDVTHVDVALVLAVDISLSMDSDEQRLQRDGYVAAFRHPDVLKAIASGVHGRIAVAYLEWAGAHAQTVTLDWQLIGSAVEAESFAVALASQPLQRERMTSISAALAAGADLLERSGVVAVRRVIDVSGDGPNNAGPPVLEARRRVLAKGIVINGLVIQLKRSGRGQYAYFDLPDLDRYYASCVIGGPGSFMLAVNDRDNFAEGIRRKLLLEIAGVVPAQPRLIPAQLRPATPAYDCLIGEKRWRQYLEDIWQD
ncbi:MAG: DUF1194 domain-containing protein [Hyphomicrobiaceae bacterium]